jgi:peptidoglycan/LPS O-acetylase OafA/YrhL
VLQPTKIEFANTLRGIAALMVMFGHYYLIFWQHRDVATSLPNAMPLPASVVTPSYIYALNFLDPFSFGIFGVAIFFLISGFVIPFSFAKTDWKGFLIGRAMRIYPTYAAGLTFSLLVIVTCGIHYGRPFPFESHVVLFNYFPGLRDVVWVAGIDGIIWTLDVEVKFYIVCALASRLFFKNSTAVFIIPILLSIPAYLLAPGVDQALKSGASFSGQLYTFCAFNQYLNFMFIGVAFNFLYRGVIRSELFVVIVVALFISMAAIWWRAKTVPFTLLWTYGLAVLVFALAFTYPKILKSRSITNFLADISFPLYIIHGVFGYALQRVLAGMNVPAWLCILFAMAASIAIATFMHHTIESRAHLLGRSLANRFSSVQVAV